VVCGTVGTLIVVHGTHGQDALVFGSGDALLLEALIGAMRADEDLTQRALGFVFMLGCKGGG